MKAHFAWVLAGAALFAAGAANATNCSYADFKKLQFFSYDAAGILWQSPRDDSPLNSNKPRFMAHVLS